MSPELRMLLSLAAGTAFGAGLGALIGASLLQDSALGTGIGLLVGSGIGVIAGAWGP